jgi:ribosomal protein L7Ae-like RNA K-turn-binding protein
MVKLMNMLARVEELKNAYNCSIATVKKSDELGDLGRDELMILRCALVESVDSILLAYEKA